MLRKVLIVGVQTDPNYIIILREMNTREMESLFEHTKRLRSGVLMIEGKKKKEPQYAWARRARSKSRRREPILEVIRTD